MSGGARPRPAALPGPVFASTSAATSDLQGPLDCPREKMKSSHVCAETRTPTNSLTHRACAEVYAHSHTEVSTHRGVHMHVHTCTGTRAHRDPCTQCTRIHARAYSHVHACLSTGVHAHVPSCTYSGGTQMHTVTRMHVHTHADRNAYLLTHTPIHKHIHTCAVLHMRTCSRWQAGLPFHQ